MLVSNFADVPTKLPWIAAFTSLPCNAAVIPEFTALTAKVTDAPFLGSAKAAAKVGLPCTALARISELAIQAANIAAFTSFPVTEAATPAASVA